MRWVTLACRSRVTTTGTSGPSRLRSRAKNSPSASSWLSLTMAPWRCKSAPSIGPFVSTASRIISVICSNASPVTVPEGFGLAETGCTRVQPNLSAAWKVAPRAERVPRKAAGISFSRWKSRRRTIAISVGTRLKVLVSCMNRAVRTRATRHLHSRVSVVGSLGDQRVDRHPHRRGFGLDDPTHRRRHLPLPRGRDLVRPTAGERQAQGSIEIVQGGGFRAPGEHPLSRLGVRGKAGLGQRLDVLVDDRRRHAELRG